MKDDLRSLIDSYKRLAADPNIPNSIATIYRLVITDIENVLKTWTL